MICILVMKLLVIVCVAWNASLVASNLLYQPVFRASASEGFCWC